MKLIYNLKQDYKVMGYRYIPSFLIIILISLLITSCSKGDQLETKTFDTYIEKGTIHFLLNFGLDIPNNIVNRGFTIKNTYATKMVRLHPHLFDEITTKSELKKLVDEGTAIDSFPVFYFESDGYIINYCAGILVNGDYCLVRMNDVYFYTGYQGYNYIYDAQITGDYKY